MPPELLHSVEFVETERECTFRAREAKKSVGWNGISKLSPQITGVRVRGACQTVVIKCKLKCKLRNPWLTPRFTRCFGDIHKKRTRDAKTNIKKGATNKNSFLFEESARRESVDSIRASTLSLAVKENRSLLAFGSFLVPVDFSPHSKETIKYAAGLVASTGANMRILHVFQIPECHAAFYYGLSLERETVKMHVETAKREADAQLSLIAEELRSKGLSAEPLLRSGNPYEEIVNAAKVLGVGLIVIDDEVCQLFETSRGTKSFLLN